MFDPRNTLAQQVSDQLQEHFGSKLYRTVIRGTCGWRGAQLRRAGAALRQGVQGDAGIPGVAGNC